MLQHRVIPVLLLRGHGLVKGVRFRKHSYVGDPINAIRIFNEKEVDELIVLDIDATRERRSPDYGFIEQLAGECFMPLTYGGGIRSVQEASRLFTCGVEKITVQSAALDDLSIVTELAKRFGSQAVVVSVDVKRSRSGARRLYDAARRRTTRLDWLGFVGRAVAAGAGEIMLTSVDRDGTMSGMDTELIHQASAVCDVPLIAAGGVGSLEHLSAGVDAGAQAIAAGAFFVYRGPHRAVLITYPQYEELVRLLAR